MSIAIILAALVLLGGVVVVATGRGGELTREAADEPGATDFRSGADVARYRPPAALFGYHAATTEYALDVIGRAIADRDAEIGWLRARLRELQPEGERQDGTLLGLPDADDGPEAHPGQRRCDEPVAEQAVPDSAEQPSPPVQASHSSLPVEGSRSSPPALGSHSSPPVEASRSSPPALGSHSSPPVEASRSSAAVPAVPASPAVQASPAAHAGDDA